MGAMETVKEYKEKIEEKISELLEEKVKVAKVVGGLPEHMIKQITEYTLRGGKRVRGTYVIFGYKAAGGTNDEEIVKAAVSLELMQSFLLIHDDIMDQDDVRRGGPSLHAIYKDYGKKNFDKLDVARFGENIGIIAGDVLSSMGTEAIINANFDPEIKLKALKKYNDIIFQTSFGQLLDILLEAKSEFNEDDVLKVHKYKTARYTIEGPLLTGAILAGASQEVLDSIPKYGIPLGIAFQIQDDILGMYGEFTKTGKPTDSDLKEGKKTLLILKALENGTEEQKQKIRKALGNDNITAKQVNEVRQIIKDTGSYEYSKQKMCELIAESKREVEIGPYTNEGKIFMIGIADYIANRKL